MAEFLFEIGLEEVPARMIASAEAELARRVTALLERERLIAAGVVVKSYSTPRRLAVLVSGVAAKQDDLAEEMLGPSAKIAFKDGVATPAAVAFAKKSGVAVDALRTVETPKGEYLAATSLKPGRSASEVIAEVLPKELAGIYWAKNMYWRPGNPERFVRPVRWMVALLDEAVVPVEFAGYTAANLTYGHRVLAGSAAITLTAPGEYAATLEKAFVLADVEARRHRIRKALDHVCRAIPTAEGSAGTRWREDHELVDKMTHLTEWPSVIAGGFEAEYLALPEEVLVTVMRDHQNYFAVESVDGKLAPHFLAVLNTVAAAEGEAVIRHGNERVLRARFNDARFFWEFDQRVPLTERVELLSNLTFQQQVGSYFIKSNKSAECAKLLISGLNANGFGVNAEVVMTAVKYAKTDLTTELVKEFTELQGIIGGLYAEVQGFGIEVSQAIYDHYLPKSVEDNVPRSGEGAIVAISDKSTTIACMFSLGLEPTGSKDPLALRRAGNGIIKILAETRLPLKIGDVVAASHNALPGLGNSEEVSKKMTAFFAERLEFYLREACGHAYDVVKAVLAVGGGDVRDAVARAEALTAVRGSEDFLAVSAAFKRMKNILAQAAEKGDVPKKDVSGTFAHPAEHTLIEAAETVRVRLIDYVAQRNYVPAFELIATLRPHVDNYFESVMVLDPDPTIRANRLLMLSIIVADIRMVADLSEIVVAG